MKGGDEDGGGTGERSDEVGENKGKHSARIFILPRILLAFFHLGDFWHKPIRLRESLRVGLVGVALFIRSIFSPFGRPLRSSYLQHGRPS